METLTNCNVVFQDDLHNAIDGARVQIEGDTGSARVTIIEPDFVKRKFRRVEQLTGASWTKRKGTWTITGQSQHLRRLVRSKDTQLEVVVTPDVPRRGV